MRLLTLACVLLCATAVAQTPVEAPEVPNAEFEHLLRATDYLSNFQKMAAVSERVFSARAQGTDLEFAQFMGVVAKADLSDMKPCVVDIYRKSDLSRADVERLIHIFESPLGMKVRDEAQRLLEKTIETGVMQKPDASAYGSRDDVLRVVEIFQDPAFGKYGRLVASREYSVAVMECVKNSDAVKRSGLKL